MRQLRHILSEAVTLLLEYNRDITIKQHGKKVLEGLVNSEYATHGQSTAEKHALAKHRNGDSEGALNDLMGHFEKMDPSPQKKHVPHIARVYANGGIERFEDLGRVGQAFHTHHELSKRKIVPKELRDAGQFKTLYDIENVVDDHEHKLSGKEEDAIQNEKMKQQATIKDHSTFTHTIPHTEEAAKHFGRGTRWCTSAKNDNQFSSYNDSGKLHILTPKTPSYEGEKYQYHNDGSEPQLMDEKDRYVSHETLQSRHPKIAKHIEKYEEEMKKASTKVSGLDHMEPGVRANTIEHLGSNPKTKHHVEKALNDPSMQNQVRAQNVLHDTLDKDDPRPYHSMMSYIKHKGDPLDALTTVQANHPQHAAAAVDYAVQHNEYASDVIDVFANHPNLPSKTVDTMIKHGSEYTLSDLAKNSSVTDEHLKTLAKHDKDSVANAAKEQIKARKAQAETNNPKPLRDIIHHTDPRN